MLADLGFEALATTSAGFGVFAGPAGTPKAASNREAISRTTFPLAIVDATRR
jgi:hypothetical protein